MTNYFAAVSVVVHENVIHTPLFTNTICFQFVFHLTYSIVGVINYEHVDYPVPFSITRPALSGTSLHRMDIRKQLQKQLRKIMLYTAMKNVVERFSVYRPCPAIRFRLDRIQLHAFLIKSSHEAKVGKFPPLTYANVPSNLLL